MGLVRALTCSLLLSTLFLPAVPAAEFDNTSFRTNSGDLITRGMSKAEVVARFRRPDEKDVITNGSNCQKKVEVWNYYLGKRVLIITFTGNEASNIKIIQL